VALLEVLLELADLEDPELAVGRRRVGEESIERSPDRGSPRR
jgi:hypothetical protein